MEGVLRVVATYSCRKLRLIFTNQYNAASVDKTLIEPKVSERISKTRTMSCVLSTGVTSRAARAGISDVAAPWEG